MITYEGRERSSVIPVLAGFLLGTGLALLLTPRSGQQLRRDLSRGARRAKSTVEETVDRGKEQGKKVLEVAAEVIHEAREAFTTERKKSNESAEVDERPL